MWGNYYYFLFWFRREPIKKIYHTLVVQNASGKSSTQIWNCLIAIQLLSHLWRYITAKKGSLKIPSVWVIHWLLKSARRKGLSYFADANKTREISAKSTVWHRKQNFIVQSSNLQLAQSIKFLQFSCKMWNSRLKNVLIKCKLLSTFLLGS